MPKRKLMPAPVTMDADESRRRADALIAVIRALKAQHANKTAGVQCTDNTRKLESTTS